MFTGVRVHQVSKEIIDFLYKNKEIEIWDNRYNWYQNLYVVLKDETGTSSSALARVKKNKIVLLDKDIKAGSLCPRNKEQRMAIDALMDDSVKVVVLTGRAGTGKTIMTLAAAINKIESRSYNKIILTKPMSQVTKYDIGALPGDVNDKFKPYLDNYFGNLEFMFGDTGIDGKQKAQSILEQYRVEFVPLQLIRGCSWHNAFILADECQTLDHHEMVTLGTRVGEGSKIVIMGDLAQRDEKISKESTGIYKFINDEKATNSEFVASIELLKSERGEVSALFGDIFEAY